MDIKKILNNNAIITTDDKGREVVAMGKGIAYGKSQGDVIDDQSVTKLFKLSDQRKTHLEQLLSQIPDVYLEVSQLIIQRAQSVLGVELNDSIYLTLTDHLHSSVARANEGFYLKNKLQWEISQFYPKEYQIGCEALHIVESMCNVKLPIDEAGFIAIHLVSSESGDDISVFYEITNFIQDILNIVKYFFKFDYDVEGLAYSRFLVHLKFFGTRVLTHNSNQNPRIENDILSLIKDKYVDSYQCALRIKKHIYQIYDYILDEEEILFLTIHIARVTEDERGD